MSDLIHQLLERNANKFPDDLSLICHVTNTSLTWAEENGLANQLAQELLAKGYKKNDHIGIFYSNQVEFVITYFAIAKIGATVVPLNVRLTASEIKGIVASMDITGIIYHPNFKANLEALTIDLIPFTINDKSRLASYSSNNLDILLDNEGIAEILLTSGTTGNPKGVMLSHRAVYQTAMMMSYEMQIYNGDKVLQIMPLTHSAPLNLMMVGSVFAGASSILDNFDPEKILIHTENDQATHFFGAPIAYLLALKILQEKQYDLTSMKKWIYGGAPMPSNYLAILQEKFPGEFVGVYGLTEAGPNGLALYPEEHEKHIGTIGKRATINTEYRLVDDNNTDVGKDLEGEVILKTGSMMSGYYKNPIATEEAIKDGWLYTGDIGKIDEDGYLHIIDRKKDVILSGGVNIYPSEIEELIHRIDGVLDVAVISRPHEEWGETAVAVIVKNAEAQFTEEDIKNYLKDKVAKYKIPREVIFSDTIPRNASGKILKHKLREMYS